MSPITWALALIITFVAAGVQGTVGMGFALVTVPLLSLIHPSLAPVPQLLVMFPITTAMIWRERHSIDLHGTWWIIIGRIPGAVLGVTLLTIATQRSLNTLIALIVLIAVAVIASGVHVERTRTNKLLAGIGSGSTGVIASVGGPAVALLYASEESSTIRATLATVFTFGIITSTFFRYVSGNITLTDVRVTGVLLPATILGYIASIYFRDRIEKEQIRRAILVVSALSAFLLLLRST